MILDRKQVKWAVSTAIAALSLASAYLVYAWLSIDGFRSRSTVGLGFGVLALGIFVFECLLSLRKRFSVYLAGRVQMWLRAHLWLGLLSFLLVLLHAGFRWGTGLAAGLMWLIVIVVLSGVIGVALQNYLPRRMQELVEKETVFAEIPHVITTLRAKADERLRMITQFAEVAGAAQAIETIQARYRQEIRPYLEDKIPHSANTLFRTPELIRGYFGHLSLVTPPPFHDTLDTLESICEERRQLAVQRMLHNWLHGWLLVHVPLSFALLVLTFAHAILALRY